eukprot:g2651.t1 g2651   contig12:545241-547411(+)
MKHPNQNVGVILTRHSKTKPNVTVISRVMNDSIFAQYKGLVGMQVTAVNGIPIQNARQAAELIILANREVSLTVKHVQENELTQASLKCDRIGMMQSVDSEETNSSTPSEQGMEVVYNDIIEMASSRLKASLRDRMRQNLSHSGSISVDGSLDSSIKRKISSFDRHFKHQTDVIDIALMPSYGSESTTVLSVDSPRNVTKKHDDDASASSISFYLGISRSDAWDDMTETDAKTFPSAPPSSDDLAAQKHGCLDSGILANGSSVTASTVDLTEILSSIEASCSLCSSGEESSNTRYILSVDTMQTDDVDVADTLGDLSTPALIMMASKFEQKVLTPRKFEQKVLTPDAFVSPTTKVNNVFSRMMFKYEVMSNERKQQNMDIQSRSTSKESSYCGFDSFDDRGSFLPSQENVFLPTNTSPGCLKKKAADSTKHLKVEVSYEEYIHISSNYTESRDDDAVSTLSRNSGVTTIGSASFCTADTDKINAHVQKLVSSIVKTELNTAGTMRCALEEALRSKAKLEAKIKKLEKKSGEQMLQLREARRTQRIAVEEYENELEVHLTRKAAQLKECVELALAQAEASKRREVELARGKMEMEIALLRSQLDDALENGVVVDGSLRNALDLVESNQEALREAAANNARSTLSMKNEIEHSFISAVTEFEVWSDKHVEKI